MNFLTRNASRIFHMPLWLSLLLASQLSYTVSALPFINTTTGVRDWDKVPTSTDKINWTPCFDGFLCTRLLVPLDWEDASIGTTKVAFIKYRSKNESAEDLLLNFGGPGGSGVGNLLALAPYLAEIYGPGVNLVSFDPRGVNNTGPLLDCFPGKPTTTNNFDSLYYRTVSDGSLDDLTNQFYLAEAFGQWCNGVIGGPNGTAKYANTPSVARDMIAFIEAQNVANGKRKEDAKLWFAGYSYGTVLGATFASLYPGRVARMILDGVSDGENYYRGLWDNNLFDADAVVDYFITSCFDAGPGPCPLWAPSPELITQRMSTILTRMRMRPLPVWNASVVAMPSLATYADLTKVLLNAVYNPLVSFPPLARILADLEQGNGDTLMAASSEKQNSDYNEQEAMSIIQCVDAGGRNNISSIAHYREYTDYLMRQSKYIGEAWPSQVLSCRTMDVIPPASGQLAKLRPAAERTNFPLMLIANTADPVTPMRSARGVSADFPASVMLTLEAAGHTSLAAPSKCLNQRVQAYLAGSLPPANSTCQPDELPFRSNQDELTRKLAGAL